MSHSDNQLSHFCLGVTGYLSVALLNFFIFQCFNNLACLLQGLLIEASVRTVKPLPQKSPDCGLAPQPERLRGFFYGLA